MIKGMDISTLKEVEACGGKFYDQGEEKDLFKILKSYDVNSIRLRLWNDPYAGDGSPYGAGTNDLETTISLARRVKQAEMGFLLDFHYSDFWTDPEKQKKPKAWAHFGLKELKQAVFQYTKEVLQKLKKEQIAPTMIQVGNEITHGFLWPEGKIPNYDNIAALIRAGICAIREELPEVPVMLHLDNGGNNKLYRDWFDHYMEHGEDFDIIGLSYYPFWHGTLEDLQKNMNDIAVRYHKDLIVAEVSMGYTMEDYSEYEKLSKEERKGMATRAEVAARAEYPMTVEGQCQFMQDFMKRIGNVPENRGKGFYYWEPAWIPVAGSGWATKASLEYMGDAGPCGNEWANQALFDYKGNALKTLQVIRDF